ncbi:unnamed protein product [Owenia fusiformis]|uniref:Link domain-containing protein n=1 Tax=Owenia fusiformis TaxID=6347 RepID=A0A8S4NGC8_OWEFU|nr:unnamed protein product [Owenia fusiformis]
MMRQVISVFFICATILYVKAVPPRCTRADIKKLNSTVINSKSELIEVFDSTLQVIKNDINAELTNEIDSLTEKITEEINENEGKLNALKEELIEAFNSKLIEIKNDIKAELTAEINQNEDKLNALKTQNQGTLSTLTAQLTKTTTELSDCACERKRQRSIIYFAGPYIYTFAAAKAYCKSKGHKIATPAQIQAAFDLGMQLCSFGWLKDGSVRYPHQMPFTNGWCGHRGVNTDLNHNPLDKFGVYCATNPGPD